MKQFELTPLRREHVDRILTTYPDLDDTTSQNNTKPFIETENGPHTLTDFACEDCGKSFTAYPRNVTECIFCGKTDLYEC